jgi:DNA-binding response OmpR family regulator
VVKDIVMRVLLAEDDPQLGSGIRTGLEQAGYTVDWLTRGDEVRHALEAENFDIMILDLGLPNKDGLSLLREARAAGLTLPVLILTARDTVADRVAGLDVGADDYMNKPFDLDELHARIRALLRRHSGRAEPLIRHGEVVLDPAARLVMLGGQNVSLTAREFAVLHLLLENAGRVLSREQIEEKVYGWNELVESNSTEVHIHHLRKKLGKDVIVTVRGVGYMIPKSSSPDRAVTS